MNLKMLQISIQMISEIRTIISRFSKIFLKTDTNLSPDISELLIRQYSNLNPSNLTQENIKKLSDKKTLTIVTGQQLGIFGGPLYTFYKIITTIKLSRFLSERYNDYNFVPVFWLEADDHDFNEVRSIKIIDEVKFSFNNWL